MFPNWLNTGVAALLTVGALAVGAETRNAPAEEPTPRLDAQGDPLPDEAVSRLGTTRLRCGGHIANLDFTPDGKTLVSGGADGVRTWDAATGKPLRQFPGDGAGAAPDFPRLMSANRTRDRFALAPDGKWLALLGNDAIRICETETGKEVRSFGGKGMWYCSARFSPDGKRLAALGGYLGQSDKTDPKSAQPGDECFGGLGRDDGTATEFMDDQFPEQLVVERPLAIEVPPCSVGRTEKLRSLPVSATTSLASWTRTRANYGPVSPPPNSSSTPGGPPFPTTAVCWRPSSRTGRAIGASASGTLRRARKGTSSSWRRRRRWIGAGSVGPTFRSWLSPGRTKPRHHRPGRQGGRLGSGRRRRSGAGSRSKFGPSHYRALVVSQDGKTLALTSDVAIRLFDLKTGKERWPRLGHQENIVATAVTADGRTVATACAEQIVLWDAATGRELDRSEHRFVAPAGRGAVVKTAADGRSLFFLEWGEGLAVAGVSEMGTTRRKGNAPLRMAARVHLGIPSDGHGGAGARAGR